MIKNSCTERVVLWLGWHSCRQRFFKIWYFPHHSHSLALFTSRRKMKGAGLAFFNEGTDDASGYLLAGAVWKKRDNDDGCEKDLSDALRAVLTSLWRSCSCLTDWFLLVDIGRQFNIGWTGSAMFSKAINSHMGASPAGKWKKAIKAMHFKREASWVYGKACLTNIHPSLDGIDVQTT